MNATFFAHSATPPVPWEPLERHLAEVAELAAVFTERFNAAPWGALAGRWHDLGKYSDAFQRYLGSSDADPHVGESIGRVDHSGAGAQHAHRTIPPLGTLLAYLIAGHHAGLPDGVRLRERLGRTLQTWEENCPDPMKGGSLPVPPLRRTPDDPPGPFRLAFFLRMIFSALVDADFLCTEKFMSPKKAEQRAAWPSDVLGRMEGALVSHLDRLGVPTDTEPPSQVNRERFAVRQACEAAAVLLPGFFDLTVPTGGGKTLASLLFALRHARLHGLDRVVYVIPYTSIIEQTAVVFRGVFKDLSAEYGQDVVVEHHSNFVPAEGEENTRTRLVTENWDAPLVVTTNVQFFESLFARRTSTCRKLHRVARSVVILDEAQALPVGLLSPILTALRCLVQDYGSTVVLCTATQPALERRDGFDPGIPPETIRPIVQDRARLYETLRRTEVRVLGAQGNAELKHQVLNEPGGALVVVNTTKAAREFYDCLDAGVVRFHLSARMCPAHRRAVLAEVKLRLASQQAVILVSTQLIEAGVDVSFPAVYRAECGLDSLAQAAGRCNRHGELRDENGLPALGRVFHFHHAGYEIPKLLVDLQDAAADAGQLLTRHASDLLSLAAIEDYFRLHIWTLGQRTKWDHSDVMDCFQPGVLALQFEDAAKRFQMIPEGSHALVVPWGDEGGGLCKELRARHKIGLLPDRDLYRKTQQFTVQVYAWEWRKTLVSGRVEALHDDAIHLLIHPENDYDDAFGLRPPDAPDSATAFMI